jgi:hypothetical protein
MTNALQQSMKTAERLTTYSAISTEFATGTSTKTLPPAIAEIVTRYAPMTAVMNKFHRILKTDSKNTPYPVNELEMLSY